MKNSIWLLMAILALTTVGAVVAPVFAEQSKDPSSAPQRVDINAATVEELTQLPGIGEKVAARIVAYREESGRFQKIEEIMNVRGIGEKTFIKLKDRLVVREERKKSTPKKNKS